MKHLAIPLTLTLTALVGCGDPRPEISTIASAPDAAAPNPVAVGCQGPYAAICALRWPATVVPVCVENRLDYPAEAGWVEDAVEQLWDRGSALELGDWGPCGANQRGIHVRLDAKPTATGAVGIQLDGMADGVVINIDPCPGTCTPAEREVQVRLQAVEAFEQALVVAGTPLDPSTCVDGEVVETCAWPARLTNGVYGALVDSFGTNPGTLRGIGKGCLTATGDGEFLHHDRCNDASAQIWAHRERWAPPRFHLPLESTDGRVAYGGAPVGRGDLVLARTCQADDPNAKWVWEDGRLRHFVSGLCLRAPWTTAEQPLVTLGDCDDQLAVRWTFDAPLAMDGTGLCVTPRWWEPWLYTCPGLLPPASDITPLMLYTYTP